MDIIAAPDTLDVQDFQFKLHRRIKIFDSSVKAQTEPLDLVATASPLGLLFIGSPDKTLRVLQLKDVVNGCETNCQQRIIQLSSIPINVSLNCTCELLSIVVTLNGTPVALVYNTKSLITENPTIQSEIRLSPSPNVRLCRLLWNPCQPDSLAVCMSDGSLSVFLCKPSSVELQTKATNARCLSWSPKGKQIVTGDSDGTLNQYKPDLTLVKTIPAAKFFDKGTSALTIHWISNYQFCVVFKDSSNPENRPCVAIINTPKNGPTTYINYDDICYSMGDCRENQFFLLHLPTWNVILASSANSMEIGVLGTKDQNNWQQWIQIDEARAELPLTDDKQESYPIGISLDNSAILQLPWGDGQILPHMPMLHILSHTGMLISFYVINLNQNVPNICIVPETLNIPQNLFIMDIPRSVEKQKTPPIISSAFQSPAQSNIITSTPTIPRSAPTNINKPISTNLFGQIIEDPLAKNNSDFANKTPIVNSSNLPIKKDNTKLFAEKPIVQENQNKFTSQPIKQEVVPSNDVKQPTVDNSNKTNKNGEKSFESVIKSVPSEVIKSMLLSEVNSFQKDFFELLQKCKSVNIEVGNSEETKKITTALSSKEKKSPETNWCDEDMKKQMTMLKYNLINTCAFLAEARMQPASSELEHLAQLDPVSTSKMNSIKLTMYYIESQLRQVNSVLDEQWETFQDDCRKKSLALSGTNEMKIPSLEKIYQPLLKQSEILIKQQSIITSLQNTIDGMDLSSISKTSKKNTTSKIIENNDKNKSLSMLASGINNLNLKSGSFLGANQKNSKAAPSKAKFDALRKILSDHKTTKIKSVKFEPPTMIQSFNDWNSINKIEAKLSAADKTSNIKDSSPIIKESSTKTINNNKNNNANQTSKFVPNITPSNPVKFGELTSKTDKPNETKFKSPESLKSSIPSEIPKDSSLTKTSTAFIFQNIFGKSASGETKPFSSNTISFPSSSSPSIVVPTAVSSSAKTPTIPVESSFKVLTPSPVTGFISDSSAKLDIKDFSLNTPLVKDTPKSVEISKPPVSVMNFSIPASTAPLKNFSFSFAPAISSAFSATSNTTFPSKILPPVSQPKPNTEIKSLLQQPVAITTTTSSVSVASSNSVFLTKTTSSMVSSAPQIAPFNAPLKVTSPNSNFTLNITTTPTQKESEKPVALPISSLVNNPVKSVGLNIVPPNVSIPPNISIPPNVSVSNPLPTDLTKSSNQAVVIKSEPIKTPISITSETIAIPIEKSASQISFGSSKPPETPSTSTTTPISAFTPTTTTMAFPANVSSIFPTTPASSLTISPTQTPTTQVSVFGSPQQLTSSFPSLNTGSVFGTPNSTANVTPQNIFKTPTAVNTCASSLFGAASAAIDTSVASLFGNTSISTTNAQSPFGNANSTTSSIFGGQTTFSTTGNSIFGGNASTFGQPQANVFGGGATFGGGFGTASQPANIFGQAAQSTNNAFGVANTSNQTSVFGNSPFSNNAFGSPASPPQQSVFGSPTTLASPVFGGSPTFGSKPAFGQAPSFGSSPQGAFGLFSGNDQTNSSPGAFGGSPKFGGSPSFGAPPAFGAAPAFGGNVNSSFGSPSGFGTGSQQSSTFESLATQSTLSFGNLAQQTQQTQQQSQPLFQSSSSFSTWR